MISCARFILRKKEFLPEFPPWEHWCNAAAAHAFLPSGEVITADRGAGQGEPDGPLKAALALGLVMRRVGARLGGAFAFGDMWFIDDGQFFVHPKYVSSLLEALDAELHMIGASRGSISAGDDVKSIVRVFGHGGQVSPDLSAFSHCVLDTCMIHRPGDPVCVLGGWVASPQEVTDKFEHLWTRRVGGPVSIITGNKNGEVLISKSKIHHLYFVLF